MSLKTLVSTFLHAIHRVSATTEDAADESPLRARLLSAEQMERHGKKLARTHRVGPSSSPELLLARLGENQNLIEKACRLLGANSESSSPSSMLTSTICAPFSTCCRATSTALG